MHKFVHEVEVLIFDELVFFNTALNPHIKTGLNFKKLVKLTSVHGIRGEGLIQADYWGWGLNRHDIS